MRSLRWASRLLALGCLALVGASLGSVQAGAVPVAPFTDPSVQGYIGLCNQAGQQITSGSLTDTPFVWRAVSSQPAEAPYNAARRTAILVAYLPLQQLPPGDWSGSQLTSSSRYTNPQSPMAQATSQDISLAGFVSAFPPQWDGFIQLRMFLGAPDEPAYQRHYPSLDIYVSGNTWTAVGGGPVNCNAGSAESLETIVLPSTTTTTAGSGAKGGAAGAGTTGTGAGGGSSGGSNTAASSGGGSTAASAVTGEQTTSSGHNAVILAGLIVVAIGLVLAILFVIRRQRSSPNSFAHAAGTSPKGS
jgi:hypothetical protein